MTPEERASKWMEVAGHLQAETSNGRIRWDHQGVHTALDRTGDSVSLTEVTTSGSSLSDLNWEGLTEILWIAGHKVALVFKRDGHKRMVTISKDSSPVIVGEPPATPTSREGTVS